MLGKHLFRTDLDVEITTLFLMPNEMLLCNTFLIGMDIL